MADDEIKINYDTLFEFVRNEKTRENLQKLPKTFVSDLLDYLREKSALMNKDDTNPFAAEEKQKNMLQMQNIRRLIKDLYEKREKKILTMAMDKSRMPATIVDYEAFLEHEKELFDTVYETLTDYRKEILVKVSFCQMPILKSIKKTQETVVAASPKETILNAIDTAQNFKPEIENKVEKIDPVLSSPCDYKVVRFTGAVPKFVGTNLEEFGPFEEDEIANIPSNVAEILIKKERAEEITAN